MSDSVIRVNATVHVADVSRETHDFNLMSYFAEQGFGARIVAVPDQQQSLYEHLSLCFPGAVDIIEVETHVPQDWNEPGFVSETVNGGLNGNAWLVMSSGLGLHTAT